MGGASEAMGGSPETHPVQRETIAFSEPKDGEILQKGDAGFTEKLERHYSIEESNALEALIDLKQRLRECDTQTFWNLVTTSMGQILGAEMALVVKRVLVDEQNAAVEMPPIGQPGSCLMAAAFYYCDSHGAGNIANNFKYHAWGCPCAYMRLDKVFLIPGRLNEFAPNNPNNLPVPGEAYMAIPLFAEGKCFAHFGVLWYPEGASKRKLSWGFIEMFLHSLEDMILNRFLDGSNFVNARQETQDRPSRVIPHEAITAAQSLRPYAGSLSHELRTPMQGVVGMLDVMYATVQEAAEGQTDPESRQLFATLKENIEMVQDSSRRAVEAADNVVHAYDMDMSVPDGPPNLPEEESGDMSPPFSAAAKEWKPDIIVAGSNLPISRPNKRRRDDAFPRNIQTSSRASDGSKIARLEKARSVWTAPGEEPSETPKSGVSEAEGVQLARERIGTEAVYEPEPLPFASYSAYNPGRMIAPGLRHANLREVLQYVINDGIKLGGRPDSAIAQETDQGEIIEVRIRGSDGSGSTKTIDWAIDPSVPETMFVDEKDLGKLISCVFLNAFKFTSNENGKVKVQARLSSRGKYITMRISDNGPGIPDTFLPKLFKPFSQENGSLTRQSEGLGLGLLVAKGIARKLGGDLLCTRTETEGPHHGSEFEIKVPIQAGETITRPSSPFGSPMPRRANLNNDSHDGFPFPPSRASPRALSRALHKFTGDWGRSLVPTPPLPALTSQRLSPSTPPSPRTTVKPAEAVFEPATSMPTRRNSRPRIRKSVSNPEHDRHLAEKHPLTFLVAEDNRINRKLLVSMLAKLGYRAIHEAHDGTEAVRQMQIPRPDPDRIDVVLMDLWMPLMDGYEATEKILAMHDPVQEDSGTEAEMGRTRVCPTVLAVTADVTDGALERAAQVGMKGFMTKPYKLLDLQRLILEYCARRQAESEAGMLATVAQ